MKFSCIFRKKLMSLKILTFLMIFYIFVKLYEHHRQEGFLRWEREVAKSEENFLILRRHNEFSETTLQNTDTEDSEALGASERKRIDDNNRGEKSLSKKEEDGKSKGDPLIEMMQEIDRFAVNDDSEVTEKIPKISCVAKGISKRYREESIQGEDVACQPHQMPQEACKFTQEVFEIDEKLQTCKDNKTEEYCSLEYNEGYELHFVCNNMKQYRSCKISGLNKKNGDIEVKRGVSDLSELAMHLMFFAKVTIAEKSNFLFLKCFSKFRRKETNTQLILLPFDFTKKKSAKISNKLNINIVLLDSISRSHFHRSLPAVLKTFSDINKDLDSKAEVLDFELFQAVHGHSAENFHAFFTGELLPNNLTATEREHANVGVGYLYKILKDFGYQTMYPDDLCWRSWWGLRMELGMAANWKSFQRAIGSSSIDHTGLTFASCKILGLNHLKTPFNGPENDQICLNGRFQHSFVFEHLFKYFKSSEKDRIPRFSFTTINTGHDYKGIRVQTLNKDLSTFARKLSKLDNTLTIMMADHGNTYTSYTSTMLEGRFEMHHPSFFMILPENVRKWLGSFALNNLRRNTKRLFTMVDVHQTILELVRRGSDTARTESKNRGLLSLIPATRRCNDLRLALPNLCVCEGWDTPAKNDTTQIGVLEFAVGTLNNLIESQRQGKKSSNVSKKRKCSRLVARSFRNVRERNEGDDLITTMDFTANSGPGSGQSEEVFHVEVRSTITRADDSRNMKLLSYDRISQYGIYRKCSDPGVNVKLCVCSLKGDVRDDEQRLWLEDGDINISRLLNSKPHFQNIPSVATLQESTESECIYIFIKEFKEQTEERHGSLTSVIEIMNICTEKDLFVHLDIETTNCKTSQDFPITLKIKSQSIHFASVIIRAVWYWKSSYHIWTSVGTDENFQLPDKPIPEPSIS